MGCTGRDVPDPMERQLSKRNRLLQCHAPKARTERDVSDPMGPPLPEGHTRAIGSESRRASLVGPAAQ